VELAARYINDRKLPDKAIDVIDETGASQMLIPEHRRKRTIGVRRSRRRSPTMARIPAKTVSKDDAEVLAELDSTLKRVVYGQEPAIDALTSAIKLARAGLRDGEKPIGSYLFAGPTGVGKTEVAKQLALSLGVELLRFDMSEYMERHTVSRLIGAPPAMSALTRAACSPTASTSTRIASFSSTRSRRRIRTCSTSSCR
jgi:ATP-dependent Clp protease ATP-binding subunit ClpA